MAKGQHWDVWMVASNQVYRNVPADVVAGWAESGRLAAADKLRAAGTDAAWSPAKDAPGVGGFFAPDRPAPPPTDQPPPEIEFEPRPRRREAEDDEVDMIPLIDVSLVLLVFFMLTTVVSTMPSVDVPTVKQSAEFAPESKALLIQVEQPTPGALTYSVRPVESGPAPGDANLKSLPELISRLELLLAGQQTPPAVRVASHRSVPTGEFLAVFDELEKLRGKKRIESYTTDVQEGQ